MSRRYVHLATDSACRPEWQAAGFWGLTVMREAMCLCGQYGDTEGFLGAAYLDEAYLARRLGLTDPEDVTKLRYGVTALIKAGLLVTAEGGYELVDWVEDQPKMAMTNAQRQAKHRAKRALEKARNESALRVTESNDRRGEERRGEEAFAGPALPAAAPLPAVPPVKKQKPLGLVHEAKAKPNPRHAPLVHALTAAYENVIGEHYAFGGAKDAVAVNRLILASEDDAEIVRRFGAALVHEKDFHRVSTIAAFAAKWNEYAPRQVKRDVTQGRHRAEDSIPDEVDERGNFIHAAR